MQHMTLGSRSGYRIPCTFQLSGATKTLLICHGFGSSQDSPMVQALRKAMPRIGVDTVSFDFPQHGESLADSSFLRIPCCLSDLQTVEEEILKHSPNTELIYFGSSFGAYVILLYLANCSHVGKRVFLRSTAVDMHGIILDFLKEGQLAWTSSPAGDSKQDFCAMDSLYDRPFSITKAFVEDLSRNNLLTHYTMQGDCTLSMIHGALDSTATFQKAQEFARKSGARLHVLPEGEHRLMGIGELEAVLQTLTEFL